MLNNKIKTKKLSLALAIAAAVNGLSGTAIAQENEKNIEKDEIEVIEVTGIRSALASALAEKRSSQNIKEVIQAEDIGKLPDQNLAEVLENVTGVQITRDLGVGTGVQIRGTDANRVEINGVSTVGSGTGRSGIDFADLPAALIASLEVTKVPDAKAIEGSVGGTVNLRTLRGLSLKERLTTIRVQGEHSELAETTSPRLSGTYGDKWTTDIGKVGVVVTGSYTEQAVSQFTPRYDRDRINLPGTNASSEEYTFLKTQFFTQQLGRKEYETTNLTGSIEYEPNEDTNLYLDVTINDQQIASKASNISISGTGGSHVAESTVNTAFETIDLGTIDGPNGPLVLGEVQAVLQGVLDVGVGGSIDPNVRTVSSAGARNTESHVYAFGGKWTGDNLTLSSEVSYSDSESANPSLFNVLDFINPNGPQPSADLGGKDNGTPIQFDASGNMLQFGIAQGLATSPSTAELLDPSNYAIRNMTRGLASRENSEAAFRFDATYYLPESIPFFTEIEAGIRWNENSSVNDSASNRVLFTGALVRPTGDLFEDVITAGPSHFNSADNRTLYFGDYMMIDKDLSYSDPDFVVDTLNSAILAQNAAEGLNNPTLDTPTNSLTAFFDITEATTALYAQANFEQELGDVLIRGNIGARYLETEVDSLGNNLTVDAEGNAIVEQTVVSGSYNYFLPRFNVVAEFTDQFMMRAGVAKDIRRPNFDQVKTSTNWNTGIEAGISRGNPDLQPEEVISFDVSAEYFISESAFVSVGLFHKIRSNLFTSSTDYAAETVGENGQIERDITPPCEGGGIFNPTIPGTGRGVWSSSEEGNGICVPLHSQENATSDETQSGIEVAVQYDLSAFEESLGWASGFGIIANYTYQEAGADIEEYVNGTGDANALNILLGRTDGNNSDGPNGENVFYTETLDDDFVQERLSLPNLSENAYNFTMFYDKHDISVRARYTWRSAYRTSGGPSFGLRSIKADRGQLNLSASYDITENFTVGIEGVNLLRDDQLSWCVNEGALLCDQAVTDRRVTAGITARF